MSNDIEPQANECDFAKGCNAVQLIIQPKDKDLGGFSVRRALPNNQQKTVGPWIFFDHMGPAEFPAGQGINVRPHPHINLATVTYLFEGEILHRDSLGTVQEILPGDLNLMVAGKGIVHSERERPEVTATNHRIHGLQLWLALPEADEEVEPAFYHYDASEIPELEVDGVPVRVMIGSAFGVTSPAKAFAETLYVEAHLQAGQRITLPDAEERAVYIATGELKAGSTTIPNHAMAVFSADKGIVLEAVVETRLAIVGGEAIGPRFLEWNFVSSREERLEQAKDDWKAQRFPKVPGDEEEFIPFPS